jgi:hypothetical protein
MAMKNRISMLLTAFVLVLFGAITIMAQDQPAAQSQESSAPAATSTTKKHAKAGMSYAAKPETLSGTISSVDADKNLVVVSSSDGIPYDFTVSKGTKITAGGTKAKLGDLQSGKQVSVSFVAEKKRGDVARNIEVTQ